MKLLLNPMVLRLAMLLLVAVAAFVVGAIAIRRTRKSLVGVNPACTRRRSSSKALALA